jgi:hypothetical protein
MRASVPESPVRLADEEHFDLGQIAARQRRQAIVFDTVDRTFGVEEAHGDLLRGV